MWKIRGHALQLKINPKNTDKHIRQIQHSFLSNSRKMLFMAFWRKSDSNVFPTIDFEKKQKNENKFDHLRLNVVNLCRKYSRLEMLTFGLGTYKRVKIFTLITTEWEYLRLHERAAYKHTPILTLLVLIR